MRCAGDHPDGLRMRGLIIVLWRAGLRISEALALAEGDLDPTRGAILVRCGKGGKRREVGMDPWAWEQLTPWLRVRATLPLGVLFCVIHGATRGRPWSARAARQQIRRIAAPAGVRRRFASHQLRHAHGRRDGPRGRTARCHPATARALQPRHHVGVLAGDRQRRDHRHHPRPPCTDDPGQRRPTGDALKRLGTSPNSDALARDRSREIQRSRGRAPERRARLKPSGPAGHHDWCRANALRV